MHSRPLALIASCISFAVVAAAAGCADSSRSGAAARGGEAIIDDFGDTVPARAYGRVVSLNPTTTEALFGLGAGPRMVGRSTWDSWPTAAAAVADVGSALRPNVEQVLAVKPDLVLLYASADNREAARQLRTAGVVTAAFRVDSIAHFMRLLPVLGLIIGDTAGARIVGDTIRRSLDSIRAANAEAVRPSVVMPTWYSPLIVIGGGSHLNELIEIAGGRNVYADISHPSPQVSMEDLLLRDPDVILVTPGGGRRIITDPRWRALRAVRDGRVLEVDTSVVGRPSVTLGSAAANIATLLHGDR